MRYTISILLIVIFAACRSDSEKSRIETSEPNEKAIANLLNKFREARADTLEINSTDELESEKFAFRGTRLDSFEISMLPKKMRDRFVDNDFYGCYRFTLDSSHIGLIIRAPSWYSTSSIKLFVFENSSKQVLEPYIELAESTGDAGYSLTKRSLILKEDEQVNYLIWQHEGEDMSVEDENDTTITSNDALHLVTFNKSKFDTLDSNTERLLKKYAMLKRRVD